MGLDDFLKEYVVGNNKILSEKIKSKQYPLSNHIMELETKLGLDQKQTAKYLAIPLDKLIQLESVDLSVSVNEYQVIINKLESKLSRL